MCEDFEKYIKLYARYLPLPTGWRKVPQQIAEVPGADFWLYHELVPALAQGCPDCRLQPFPGRI